MRGEELAHFAAGRVLQPHRQPPVVEPGLEHVAFELLGVLRELDRVAGAVGVVGAEQRTRRRRAFGARAAPAAASTQAKAAARLRKTLKIIKLTIPHGSHCAQSLAPGRARAAHRRAARAHPCGARFLAPTNRRLPRALVSRPCPLPPRLLLADQGRVRRPPSCQNAARPGGVDRASGRGRAENSARSSANGIPASSSRRARLTFPTRSNSPELTPRRGASADERLGSRRATGWATAPDSSTARWRAWRSSRSSIGVTYELAKHGDDPSAVLGHPDGLRRHRARRVPARSGRPGLSRRARCRRRARLSSPVCYADEHYFGKT